MSSRRENDQQGGAAPQKGRQPTEEEMKQRERQEKERTKEQGQQGHKDQEQKNWER